MQPSKPSAPVRAASRCVALHWWSHVARQLSAAIPPKSRVRLSFARQERKLRGEVKRRRSVEVSALQTKADSAWLNERASGTARPIIIGTLIAIVRTRIAIIRTLIAIIRTLIAIICTLSTRTRPG